MGGLQKVYNPANGGKFPLLNVRSEPDAGYKPAILYDTGRLTRKPALQTRASPLDSN